MFGRKKVEEQDPFAALKQDGTYQSSPTTTFEGVSEAGIGDPPAAPTFAPAPPTSSVTAPQPVTPPTPKRRTRNRTVVVSPFGIGRRSGPGGLIVGLVMLGIFAAIAIPIISSTSNAIHSIRIPSFGFGGAVTNGVGRGAGGVAGPKAPRTTNYLRPAALHAGLKKIAHLFPGARLTNLRIDSASLSAEVVRPHRATKDIVFSPSGEAVSAGGSTGEHPIPVSAIAGSAVARILAGMRRQFHVPAKRIDYIVLEWLPGLSPQWITFTKARSDFGANLNGTGLHSLGS
jgi:hypothetical protein